MNKVYSVIVNKKLLISLYVLITASGLILLKLGTTGGLFEVINGEVIWHFNMVAALGLVAYGVSFLLYIGLISKFDLGFIIPLTTALVYIIVFTASFLIFNESFTISKISAILLIIAGIILLNIQASRTPLEAK